MPTHIWGENEFDWNSLNKAMNKIAELAKENGNLPVFIKEKYGTIRYEHLYLLTLAQQKELRRIILEVSDEFPHIKDEILEDFYLTFE